MNEARRQFALGVAGVRLWYARGPLPGAAPSPEFVFDEPGQAGVRPESLPPAPAPRPPAGSDPESSRQGLARLHDMLADSPVKPRPAARPVAPASAAPAPRGGAHREGAEATGSEPVREPAPEAIVEAAVVEGALVGQAVDFHWRFWVGRHWLLVSSCSDAASRALEDRLAGNILYALGDEVTRVEALKWPVFSNPAVPGNDAAGAADSLSALVTGWQVSRQLWLGIEPEGVDPDAEAVWREVRAPLGVATVSFPGSLAALSSEPASKRLLWQALRKHRSE